MQMFPSRFTWLTWATLTLLTYVNLTTAQGIQVARMYLSFFSTFILKIRAALPLVQFGPYQIQNCQSQNTRIPTLLNTLRSVLPPIITELSSSEISSNAYTTFFKDISYAPFVRDVLRNITEGASAIPQPGTPSSAPIIVCVNGRDQITYQENGRQVDVYTKCRSYLRAPAMALLTTPYIVLCPVFFEDPGVPAPSTASCYDIDTQRNQFVQDGKSLIEYQLWHVMHELVHYYVYTNTGKDMDVYGINACLKLIGRDAVINPQSYSYYVASE